VPFFLDANRPAGVSFNVFLNSPGRLTSILNRAFAPPILLSTLEIKAVDRRPCVNDICIPTNGVDDAITLVRSDTGLAADIRHVSGRRAGRVVSRSWEGGRAGYGSGVGSRLSCE
jgi:hypothetical protein